MIDCSTNIIDLIENNPDQVRNALGIGLNDNYLILQPISGIYEDQECIFVDNQVDDYFGYIKVYAIIGMGYEPDTPAIVDAFDGIVESSLYVLNAENNIYTCTIKNYSCDVNSGLFVRTQKKRFWVNAYVCEEGTELGHVEGGCFVEYGTPVTLRAIPNDSDYTITWVDMSDPETPVQIPGNAPTHTINDITRNYTIETCFIAPPKTHTLRIFTNDGKITNLDLDKMMEGYKLGDVSVTFTISGETYTISSTDCDYGQIKTFDFSNAEESWINFNPGSGHSLDRGIILYNVPEDISLQLTSIVYSDTCCYTDNCEDTIQYTVFKGWVNEEDNVNDYNTLSPCELHYPTYEWAVYGNTEPSVNLDYIKELNELPDTAVCCDSYFIKVTDTSTTPSTVTYYYRETNPNDDTIELNNCYNQLDNNATVTIQSLQEDIDYFAIYEPLSSEITFENKSQSTKSTIGVNDYCDCSQYTYVLIREELATPHNPTGCPVIPDPNDSDTPEYIIYSRTYYRKIQYRETGAYFSVDQTATIKEIRGFVINAVANGGSDEFSSHYAWTTSLNGNDITRTFNGENTYNPTDADYFKYDEFRFKVCGNGLTITLNYVGQ